MYKDKRNRMSQGTDRQSTVHRMDQYLRSQPILYQTLYVEQKTIE